MRPGRKVLLLAALLAATALAGGIAILRASRSGHGSADASSHPADDAGTFPFADVPTGEALCGFCHEPRWVGSLPGLADALSAGLMNHPSLPKAAAVNPNGTDPQASILHRTDSRARYVHRITLYDATGRAIRPTDQPAQPYCPRATCGKCHDYEAISGGWHFGSHASAGRPSGSAATTRPADPPGPPAEPWILVDGPTGTQLPISARPWPRRYRPNQAGLSDWQFVSKFGRHLPGGGPGEPSADVAAGPDQARWKQSGHLAIDCMACHSATGQFDLDERLGRISRQQFRWAATASIGLASIRADTSAGPATPSDTDIDDILRQADPAGVGQASRDRVLVVYDKARFDADDRVFLDITRRPSPDRCYSCHTTRPVGRDSQPAPPRWTLEGDVHLAAGLTCTDCHRNGLDHRIVRGDPAEAARTNHADRASLSCQGCHLGQTSLALPQRLGGRLTAPRPAHSGLPDLHLDKLTCTACHSGPWPAERAGRVQTAMAHGLGLSTSHRPDDLPPAVQSPVFIRRDDGKIGPHRAIWPAFWAWRTDSGLLPLSPQQVLDATGPLLVDPAGSTAWRPLTVADVAKVLKLIMRADGPGEPVYVIGGRLYRLNSRGEVVGSDDPAAAPYSWPLAHDVRPAAQSLGSGGCEDCHSRRSAFFHGVVTAEPPGPDGLAASVPMHALQQVDPAVMTAWAISFVFRPVFLWVGLGCAGALTLLLARGVLLGLGADAGADKGRLRLEDGGSSRDPTAPTRNPGSTPTGGSLSARLAGLIAAGMLTLLLAAATTSYYPWLRPGSIGGWWLLAHCMLGVTFAAALVVWSATRARRFAWTDRPHWPGEAPVAWPRKIAFWGIVLFGLLTVGSIMLSMLKAMPSDRQGVLYATHRFSSLFLLSAVAAYLAMARRAGQTQDRRSP